MTDRDFVEMVARMSETKEPDDAIETLTNLIPKAQVIVCERPYHWDSDKEHPVEDWQAEVASDDTRLGYWDWVFAQREI